MIIIVHQNNKPINVLQNGIKRSFEEQNLSKLLFDIAKLYPEEIIIWCHNSLFNFLNIDEIQHIFPHKLMMNSFSTSHSFVLSDSIGYVEQSSPFININFDKKHPTFLMSSDVGGISAQVVNKLHNAILFNANFDYFLTSLAKIAMPNGLFCYSNPKLLKGSYKPINKREKTNKTLFKFVKQHYSIQWFFLLFFNILIYEKRIFLFSFITSLFYKNRIKKIDLINSISKTDKTILEIDVLIPTIGRKKYLFDVLQDLNKQSVLPKNVIIIEQNPKEKSVSELDYLTTQKWNFNIIHQFIHQTGACNARNIGLKNSISDWIFFADDDIRMETDFIEKSIKSIQQLKANAITVSCLLAHETEKYSFPFQWSTFGSGCSIVHMKKATDISFDMAFEHGFGEDADFGMQLRNQGIDIIYTPTNKLVHLKAPIGGFRTKFIYQWEKELLQPKPSPTVMLYRQKHNTKKQLLGYKTLLFIKFYKLQSVKNPFSYLKLMKKRWEVSKKWSKIVQQQTHEI